MPTWSTLTPSQQAEALAAVTGGESIDEVARRFDLKSGSLGRAIRKVRQKARGGSSLPREQVIRQEDLNTTTIESKTARIKSLDQLLAECAVDLTIWRVDHYLVNKWEVGTKTPEGDVVVTPLFQVKAWLVRINPQPLFPAVQPVTCNLAMAVPPASSRDGIRRSLVWADPHFGFTLDLRTARLTPFHDRRALDVILQIVVAADVDRVDCLGDLVDLTEWTDRFVRSPEFARATQPAILEAHWWLGQMRLAAPLAGFRLHQGNHEKRMEDVLSAHLQAAYGLKAADELDLPPAMSIPKLLALHELGIEWIGNYPDDGDWLNETLRLSHGDTAQSAPGSTARAMVSDSDTTEVFGHVHRIEWVSRTKRTRDEQQVLAGFCPGCACLTDGSVPGSTKQRQWQNGCAIVDYEVNGRRFSITPVVIEDGRAIWDGQLFEARDRLPDLQAAYPGWNWGD